MSMPRIRGIRRFLSGLPLPAGRQACLCLCRGSLQTTYTTPRRRTTLHFSQMRRTDARTFTVPSLLAVHDAAARQVVGRELDRDLVARQDADEVHPHLSRS